MKSPAHGPSIQPGFELERSGVATLTGVPDIYWGTFPLRERSAVGLKRAISELYQIFLEEYNPTYLPTLNGEIVLFTQIVGNLHCLQNVIDPNWRLSVCFQDLLLVFIRSLFSGDSGDQVSRALKVTLPATLSPAGTIYWISI